MIILYLLLGWLLFSICVFFFLEVHYFLRTCLTVLCARVFCRKSRRILEETSVTGICLTQDIDSLWNHMNNARFLRELDFAKIDFYERTGLYRKIKEKKGQLLVGATTIRYRRFIKIFTKFVIKSKIIFWDDQSVYMEHRFITTNDFVNAIVMCKVRITGCSAEEVMAEMIKNQAGSPENGEVPLKPEMSPELEKWIESNEISSQKLRSCVY